MMDYKVKVILSMNASSNVTRGTGQYFDYHEIRFIDNNIIPFIGRNEYREKLLETATEIHLMCVKQNLFKNKDYESYSFICQTIQMMTLAMFTTVLRHITEP